MPRRSLWLSEWALFGPFLLFTSKMVALKAYVTSVSCGNFLHAPCALARSRSLNTRAAQLGAQKWAELDTGGIVMDRTSCFQMPWVLLFAVGLDRVWRYSNQMLLLPLSIPSRYQGTNSWLMVAVCKNCNQRLGWDEIPWYEKKKHSKHWKW